MLRHLVLGAIVVSVCGACSPFDRVPSTVYPTDQYAHRVASSHLVLYWNCLRPAERVVRMEGVAVNPWTNQPIGFLEFDLVGVDARDQILSETKGATQDIQIHTNDPAPFVLDLSTTGGEVRFDLFYQYRFQELEMDASLAWDGAGAYRHTAWDKRFLARDVCSEAAHRAR